MKFTSGIFLLLLATSNIAFAAEPPDERPNIIVLLCDDLGYGDLGCFGHPHIQTPNLDALAGNGIRLTDCYSAAPVCSPSRAGLLTGRSPNRAGIYDWIPEVIPGKAGSKKDADHVTVRNNRELVHLRVDEVTVASLLRDAGYRTAMTGKYHCNSRFNSSVQPGPGDHGFQYWTATQNNAGPSHKDPWNFVHNGKPVGTVDGYSCQFVVDEAIRFLKQDDDSPFFVYIPFHEPHEPIASPPELVSEYEEVADEKTQAEYFANVANVDAAVGRLMQYLKETEQYENTLIVFTSDNGPETLNRYPSAARSHGSAKPLRGMKLWTTDGGFRVPGIVHWPAAVKAGQTIKTPVSSLDLLPTFVSLAGAELPDVPLDGVDLTPLITDGEKLNRTKPLCWTYYGCLNEHQVAIRHDDYKVLATIEGFDTVKNLTREIKDDLITHKLSDFEIYNVREDIDESENLFGKIDESERLVQKLRESHPIHPPFKEGRALARGGFCLGTLSSLWLDSPARNSSADAMSS